MEAVPVSAELIAGAEFATGTGCIVSSLSSPQLDINRVININK